MEAFEILDVKEFTKRIFMTDTFDNMYVTEAEFLTFVKFNIGGKLNKAYFDEENNNEFCLWKSLRQICFDIIKGKRTPTAFKLVMKFPEKFTKEWIEGNIHGDMEADMYLNIRYFDKKLHLVTSFSPKSFVKDKDILHIFDKYVKDMFKKMNIAMIETGEGSEG